MTGRHFSTTSSETLRFDANDPAQRRLGDYQLLGLIGEGGMGVVYRARQISLDREVAVKVLTAGSPASAEVVERFHREAQNAARMQHPNIVAIYEVGSAGDEHFFSMRLVHGSSLAAQLKHGSKLEPKRAAALLHTIAEAVDYAHNLGVLHLDLKPGNVLIDHAGVPHVADFGLARRVGRELDVHNDEISGSPSYMAPEQAAAGSQRISAATDVWGLGAILYELVTGQPPFLGETPQATLKQMMEQPVAAPRSLVPDLPRDLDAIIEKCLVRDMSQRYASAGVLADDLAKFIAGRPVSARPLNPMQRLEYWARREPGFAVAAGLAMIGLLIGLVTALRPGAAHAVIPDKSIAVLPFENLSKDEDNAYFASGMQDEILTRLASIHDLKVISRTSTVQYASHPPNLKVVAEQLGVATVLEGSVQKAGDQVHINLQLIDARNDSHLWAQGYNRELKDIFAVEGEVAQNVADALKAQLMPAEAVRVAAVPTRNEVAYELYLQANAHANRAYDQDVLTAPEVPQAIKLYQQALDADPKFALAAAVLARAHMQMYFNAPDRTATRLVAAKAAADRALALQPNLGEAHYALGLYHYWGYRDYAAATEQFQLARQTLPNSADVVTVLAAIARRQGRAAEMIAGFQQATLLDPRSAFALDQLGLAYSVLRRYVDADRAYAQAEAVTREPADERVTRALSTVAWKGDLVPLRASLMALEPGSDAYTGNTTSFFLLYWCSRDFAAALRTAENDTAATWGDQVNVAWPRPLYVAWAQQASGDSAKAAETYAQVQKTVSTALLQQPDSAELHLALGFANAGLGLKDEAAREGRRAAELLPVSRDALTGAAVQVYLAQIYVRIGDNNSAFDVLRPVMQQLSGMSISPALLKLDPNWDPLRKDPRFAELLTLGEKPVEIKSAP